MTIFSRKNAPESITLEALTRILIHNLIKDISMISSRTPVTAPIENFSRKFPETARILSSTSKFLAAFRDFHEFGQHGFPEISYNSFYE